MLLIVSTTADSGAEWTISGSTSGAVLFLETVTFVNSASASVTDKFSSLSNNLAIILFFNRTGNRT
jgi:hypothetical protein